MQQPQPQREYEHEDTQVFIHRSKNSFKINERKIEEEERTYDESVANSNSFPLVEKTMRATSASHRTEISCAFFNKPDLRLEKVTCRLILFSIRFNCTLPLPMASLLLFLSLFDSYLLLQNQIRQLQEVYATQSSVTYARRSSCRRRLGSATFAEG